jgi:hypothetical protein
VYFNSKNINKLIFNRYSIVTAISILGTAIFTIYIDRRISAIAQQQNSIQQLCKNSPFSGTFIRTELFFGLSKSGRSTVTEREFQQFVNREVTPRFPDGLTLLSGSGQFENSSNKIVRESANLLILIYPADKLSPSDTEPTTSRTQKIEQIRKAYKVAFKQESVLRSDEPACVSF